LDIKRQTVSMRTRDGVRLYADIWRPEGPGPFPVLLMRQPYGRSIASTVVYAHPSWYARHGYIVVIQDVRGRGLSEGEFRLLEAELADGADTLDWAAQLPGSTGAIGMYGFSYQGMTQFFAAATGHKALKTICPAMAAWDVYSDFAYDGGAFRLYPGLTWGAQMGSEAARRAGDATAFQALFAASRTPPLYEQTPGMPTVMQKHGHYGHYLDWISNPRPDSPYWHKVSPGVHGDAMRLPMLHIGGWYDSMLTGTLKAYRAMTARPDAGPQKLVIGPWVHIPWAAKVGELDFGPTADNQIDHLQLRWFDYWLKGRDTGVLKEANVRLFEMGGTWCDYDAWPAVSARPYYLRSTGRAGLDPAEGALAPEAGGANEDVIVFDPWRPTPTQGGHKAYPLGPADRRAIDARSDVLTFTTPLLEAPLHIAGEPAIELFVTADQPSFDISVVLSQKHSDGRVINLTEGYLRVDAADSPVQVTLRPVCARLEGGSALRLSVAAGSFPAHPVNAGDGSAPAEAQLIAHRIVTLTVRHGVGAPSRLLLPAVSS
jgi:putative CocE/NonD family hydrolase